MNDFQPHIKTLLFALLLWSLSTTTAKAQLKFDRLFPPVVSIGTESTVRAEGSFKNWPPELHGDRADIKLQAVPDSKDLLIEVPADATPGIAWVRFSDPNTASDLVPLLITAGTVTVETEPNDKRSDASAITLPAVLAGRLAKNGDSDGYRVSLSAGDRLVVSVTANQVLKSPMDAVLQLTDLNGNVVAQVDDARGLDPQLVYVANADNDFLIRIFAFPETPDSSINYAGSDAFVYLIEAAIDGLSTHASSWDWIADDSRDVPQVLFGEPHDGSLPVVFVGNLTAAQQSHTYPVQTVKGSKYHASIRSQADGFLLDSKLSILDHPSGDVLASNDDGSRNDFDAQVEFTAKDDGLVNVIVTDTVGGFGPRHFYRLTVRESRPEYQLALTADHFVAAAGKPVEITVNITRRFGFDKKLQMDVAGLPELITAQSVISEPSGNTAKNVKLQLNTDQAIAGHYHFRIIGAIIDSENKATNEPVVATFALRPTVNVSEFWLTIPPQPSASSPAENKSP